MPTNGLKLFDDGDFVTIIGGNGAGKSTSLNEIAGVWPVDNESITISGICYRLYKNRHTLD